MKFSAFFWWAFTGMAVIICTLLVMSYTGVKADQAQHKEDLDLLEKRVTEIEKLYPLIHLELQYMNEKLDIRERLDALAKQKGIK